MEPGSFSIPAEVFASAARVTTAYAILFSGVILWQGMNKLRMTAKAFSKKEAFDRYNDKRMLPYDRTVGNFMEWATPFLCLFWISMIVTSGATAKWGWVYVAARAFYPFMAVTGKGIGTMGAKAPILLATVPGYVALVSCGVPIVKTLFL